MVDIRQAVSEKIKSSDHAIQERVVDHLVEVTLKKRVDSIVQHFTELDNLERDLKKVKPDIVAYNDDGSIASQAYSKKVLDDKNKLQGKIEKVKKAIDKALAGDYSELNKLGAKENDG